MWFMAQKQERHSLLSAGVVREAQEQISLHPWVCLDQGDQWFLLHMYGPHVRRAEKNRGSSLRKTSGKG